MSSPTDPSASQSEGLPKDGGRETATDAAASRRPERVREMFDRIAPRYDLANHLLSGGIDFWWRYRAAEIVRRWAPRRVLDLATGSGDLALAIAHRLPHAEVTGADFSAGMLAIAARKGVKRTVVADALALPFADASFDAVTVAFGLRNMADWAVALREMSRVLAADGRLLVLDFSLPSGTMRAIYRFYLHRCMPRLAAMVTGRKDAYDYLGASIEAFPSGAAMRALLSANEFQPLEILSLTGGIASIYLAERR